ncbi:MAG: dTDP-4-dehydrorhamnose 3,5-epimerase [Jatrophihabitantaceae bacterium]
MTAVQTAISGLWQLTTKTVTDERGTVREFFRTSGFTEAGVPVPPRWEQVNMTWTHRGGLRGLHGESATKLVGVAHGEAFGAYLDARRDSPTRGVVVTVALSVGVQMLVPPGVCNGFQAVSDPGCQYLYCFDAEWVPGMPGVAVTPLDPALAIAWPIEPDQTNPALVSEKDVAAPRFADL